MPKTKLETKIDKLTTKIVNLFDHVKTANLNAITALKNRNHDEALDVINDDVKINVQQEFIVDAAMLIAQRQPVATDLRTLIGSIIISRELERMADYAQKLAQFVIRYYDRELRSQDVERISYLMNMLLEMMDVTRTAFIKQDREQALLVPGIKIKLRNDYDQAWQAIIKTMNGVTDKSKLTLSVDMVRQLEFINAQATHLVNIAELIIYISTGKFYEF